MCPSRCRLYIFLSFFPPQLFVCSFAEFTGCARRIYAEYARGASGHSQTNEMIADGKMYKIYINMYHEICVRVRQCARCAMHKVDELYFVAGLVFHSIRIILPAAASTLPICTTAPTTIATSISYVHMNSFEHSNSVEIYSGPMEKSAESMGVSDGMPFRINFTCCAAAPNTK